MLLSAKDLGLHSYFFEYQFRILFICKCSNTFLYHNHVLCSLLAPYKKVDCIFSPDISYLSCLHCSLTSNVFKTLQTKNKTFTYSTDSYMALSNSCPMTAPNIFLRDTSSRLHLVLYKCYCVIHNKLLWFLIKAT